MCVQNISYLSGVELSTKQIARLKVIEDVCRLLLYMYERKVHFISDCQSQPAIYQTNRQGKVATSVEFGDKLNLSIDEN